jgi:hypothetical protein
MGDKERRDTKIELNPANLLADLPADLSIEHRFNKGSGLQSMDVVALVSQPS